jgi:hypothetical protein
MIDLYGLDRVRNFPQIEQSLVYTNYFTRCNFLERALFTDIGLSRFIPNILLHEFEALLFSDPFAINKYTDIPTNILTTILNQHGNDPERINNSPKTAPSKRLIHHAPSYNKILQGNLIALEIGLKTIRERCHHFEEWFQKLAKL